ncbi:MAG: hypothetical protein ABW003_26835 [Microvirga sp.]
MTDTTDAEITARAAALEEARKEFEPLVEKYAPDPFLLGLITAQMVAAHLCGYRSGRAREAARDTLDELVHRLLIQADAANAEPRPN